jgi:hypothetical protein
LTERCRDCGPDRFFGFKNFTILTIFQTEFDSKIVVAMEVKDYEGGSKIINVEELRNKLIDLRKATVERLQLQRSRSATAKPKAQ